MRITVIGTGYLGAVHAACMADSGHEVLGVDVDPRKLAALSEGRPPFFEPGLPELLRRTVDAGSLRFTDSLQEAGEFGEVHFVCVGTPQQPGSYAADMKYVDAVVDGLAPHLRDGSLVVGKSTVPVGTAARLAGRIAELNPAVDAELAWNPEFLREGFAVQDTLRPDRLVVGVTSERADAMLREVYAPMLTAGCPYISTDLATAELVKVAANSFLATKISFVNAMAEVCDAAGGDVVTLADAIGHDTRIGRRFLSAGVGFGGGCLPKDIRAFMARAGELGVGEALSFLKAVDEVNMRRRQRTVDLARELVGGSFLGKNVAILGAAFKPDSDDVRDSPALNIAAAIQLQGGQVRVHDPEAIDNARAQFPTLDYALDIEKACERADLVLHLTEWTQYRELDAGRLLKVVREPVLIDGRNTLDMAAWRSAGWTVRALGRSQH
ncbi:UDP-glucose/GDP-mannose dehydrogenase family protein [Pseudonocardia halophobica]|uniref:UDP-glucose 6-dehydrogenase n=1 Tax=Pseudonocardia halophobica TaxID=29401 RepID=A0A9W6L0E0_9PSEU|nr:UDP-glucose/GDP-mannose dehydrogenase family protein [Pseudonocardia halophobica]GLL10943.1 UDP-glucose 6-dehydrogenase [Pseudonocardia halophobica]